MKSYEGQNIKERVFYIYGKKEKETSWNSTHNEDQSPSQKNSVNSTKNYGDSLVYRIENQCNII